ncbi:hypothetical protein H6G04_02270 [Calothrix membranacea FACHB-236]|nr:hypothetical protein [Calothrix membranacea FACHB-236]
MPTRIGWKLGTGDWGLGTGECCKMNGGIYPLVSGKPILSRDRIKDNPTPLTDDGQPSTVNRQPLRKIF